MTQNAASVCEIDGCNGDHLEIAGPEWGDLAGTILHRVSVDDATWQILTEAQSDSSGAVQ